MCVDKRLQCKFTFQVNQLWHARRTINLMNAEQKQKLLEQIQARTVVGGEEVKNQEIYSLLKGDDDNGNK